MLPERRTHLILESEGTGIRAVLEANGVISQFLSSQSDLTPYSIWGGE